MDSKQFGGGAWRGAPLWFLYQLTKHLPRLHIRHRFRIVVGVFASLIAHALEVWIFAVAYYAMHHSEDWGELSGNFGGILTDAAYFSFTTYTTLGFGDIEPTGHLHILAGIGSLTVLVLITWTASFLYLEMRKDWDTQ